MPDVNLAELRAWQKSVAAQGAERERISASIVARAAELSAIEAQLAESAARGVASAASAALEKKRQRLAEAQSAEVQAARGVSERLRELLNGMRLDPGDADPAVPLALFPVRLETRYTPDRAALRVRIYPDDVHIDALDRGVS